MTDHRVPISTVFQDHGYTTIGVNTNAQLHTKFGWDRGYDVYYDSEQVTVNNPSWDTDHENVGGGNHKNSVLNQKFETLKTEVHERFDNDGLLYKALESTYRAVGGRDLPHDSAEEAVDRLLSFIDRALDDKPLFVWIHFMETHSPYDPPIQYRNQFVDTDLSEKRLWSVNDKLHTEPESLTDSEVSIISDLYNASLRYLDDQIARMFDGIEERGLWDDSVVAFTADHGEQFREHGKMTHCLEPWEEGVHVPLLLRVGDEDHTSIDRVTSTIDIAPTLLDAAVDDVDMPEKYHGISLLPVLRDEINLPDDRAVFSQSAAKTGREIYLDRRLTGARTDRWKFITSVNGHVKTKLYDLDNDPGEQENVADVNAGLVEQFQARVDEHYQQDAYLKYDIKEAVDTGEVSDRLQALGYLDH
jgi:arylsulfatase A-like enzyme